MEYSIKNYVLNSIADDYENFAIVCYETSKLAEKHSQNVTQPEIIDGIEQLIHEGLAQAYLLSPTPPHSTPVAFSRSAIEKLWFYVTPKGKRRVQDQTSNLL